MKERSSKKYFLEVIPVLLNKKGHVCLPGQAFDSKDCVLHVYSALSYDNKAWYSDVEGADPISEYDVYNYGMTTDVIGYNQGLHIIDLNTMKKQFVPITVKEFIKVRNRAKQISFNESLLTTFSYNKKSKSGAYYTQFLTEGLAGVLYDLDSIKKWYNKFPINKYLKTLSKMAIGISGNSTLPLVSFKRFLDMKNVYLPMRVIKWSHKDPWCALNDTVRRWCYQVD